MAFKLKNKKQLTKAFIQFVTRIETALIFELEVLVTKLENHAKLNAGYEDQTANLKSSIGGVVLKDGRPISYVGFEKEQGADVGDVTGLEFINSLISGIGSGYVILIVAGMEYATYVEDFHNLNVLKKTELSMLTRLPKTISKIQRKIDKGLK